MTTVKILKNVEHTTDNNWRLCFQWVEYKYEDKTNQHGYRFIWKKPNGNLQPARGQARIPSSEILFGLLGKASSEGWFVSSEIIKD